MSSQAVIAILLTITAFAAYMNYRFLKLPKSIGLTLITLLCSLVFIGLDKVGFPTYSYTNEFINSIDFNTTVMGGMISFLLFAGGLHINAMELAKQKGIIGVLATFSVVISTAVVGTTIWLVAMAFNTHIDFIYALIFGALIAPTDPIAVLGLFKRVKAPRALEMKVAGESLFNDGIGIVMFVVLLEIAVGQGTMSKHSIFIMFLQQLCGGVILGVALGYFVDWLLHQVDDYEVTVLVTLALVTGGYYLAVILGVSGPIAMVFAGLIVGNRLKDAALSKKSAQNLLTFWKMTDQTLNAILFVLIGIIVFQLSFTVNTTIVAVLAIPMVLIARYISVAVPIHMFSMFRKFSKHSIKILTWGGLRGGISIALALSLPDTPAKDEILTATYAVVVFSLLVQGLTIQPMLKKAFEKDESS